jgi:uncharacterized protein (UPF0212 family)
MQKEIMFSFGDVEALSIECGACGSDIRMRLGTKVDEEKGLTACPVCAARFDSSLKENVGALVGCIRAIAKHNKVFFRMKDELLSKQ